MKVIITIQHPAHVHFYRYVIDELEAAGHETFVFARENDLAVPLLDYYDIPHEVLAGPQDSLSELIRVQLIYEWRLLRRARRIDPDVMTAIGGVAVSHVAPIVGARSVVFLDNEGFACHKVTVPFADAVCTPRRHGDEYGAKHVRYDGYHELAYLHPNRFDPAPAALRSHGVDPDERYFVLRFRKWDALHDVGAGGFSLDGKRELVSMLVDHGEVYITSTDDLPSDLEPHRLPVPSHLIHDLLYFADCYAGDSATMATEAAVLGTPAVRVQSFAADERMTNFVELEEEYGLLRSTHDEEIALDYVEELVTDPDASKQWRERRRRLFDDKIDVVPYVVELLTGLDERDDRPDPARVPTTPS